MSDRSKLYVVVMARGRPRGFNREKALQQAMLLFWKGGYSSTSLQALQSAMGVPHPQSLKSAFGSKQKLFEEALGFYWASYLVPILKELDADDPADAFIALFENMATLYTHSSPARGCLILTSTVNLGPEDAEVGAIITGYRQRIEDLVERRLSRAMDEGHLRAIQTLGLAQIYLTNLYGMALRAQGGASHNDLLGWIGLIIEPLREEL